MDEFGTAAYTLFDVCVIHYGYGGVAERIGESKDSSKQRQQRQWVASSPALFEQCRGAKMVFLGGDNNLQIALGSLKPTVKCDKSTPGPDFVSCSDILSKIAVSRENVTFGRRAGPGVDLILPSYLLSSKVPRPFPNSSQPVWTNTQ